MESTYSRNTGKSYTDEFALPGNLHEYESGTDDRFCVHEKAEYEKQEADTKLPETRRQKDDLTGMRSGKLTVIEKTNIKRHGSYLWRCRCDCGQESYVEGYRIRQQLTKSCGCSRKGKRMVDLSGQKFGQLTAVRRTDRKRGSNYLWECKCDCGNTVYVTVNALTAGNTKSCGCSRRRNIQKIREKMGNVTEHLTLIDGTCVEKIENQSLRRDNSSGCVGVHARGDRWIASIGFKKKNYYLGIYSRFEDAVRARKEAEDRIFGEFLKWYYDNYPDNASSAGMKKRSEEGISKIVLDRSSTPC